MKQKFNQFKAMALALFHNENAIDTPKIVASIDFMANHYPGLSQEELKKHITSNVITEDRLLPGEEAPPGYKPLLEKIWDGVVNKTTAEGVENMIGLSETTDVVVFKDTVLELMTVFEKEFARAVSSTLPADQQKEFRNTSRAVRLLATKREADYQGGKTFEQEFESLQKLTPPISSEARFRM